MSQGINTPPKTKLNSKLVVFIFLMVFGGPMLFAWVAYKRSDVMQLNTVNNGTLVTPPIDVQLLSLTDISTAQPVKNDWFKQKWHLLFLLPKSCEQACMQNLYTLRQLHVALGKDAERLIRNHLFLPNQMPDNMPALLKESYPDVAQYALTQESFLSNLAHLSDAQTDQMGTIYIVDPLGNLMMTYPGDAKGKSILTDLKRLLKVSTIG